MLMVHIYNAILPFPGRDAFAVHEELVPEQCCALKRLPASAKSPLAPPTHHEVRHFRVRNAPQAMFKTGSSKSDVEIKDE